MTTNLIQTDIRYSGPPSTATAVESRQVAIPPILIRTETVSLKLLPSGQMSSSSPPGVGIAGKGLESEADGTWMWAASTHLGTPLGFITLCPKATTTECNSSFGPQLEFVCRRDAAYVHLMPKVIGVLIDWLRIHDICMVLYTDHAETDEQLAKWLIATGFLYTGCRSSQGKRQMICLLS
ncbi:hypothetical protein AEAC466_21270 [Asticcacaulis sp. AC466]|nr:hypothetical protein AEAC466_21270 [Asticcacaulis sp. AC466]